MSLLFQLAHAFISTVFTKIDHIGKGTPSHSVSITCIFSFALKHLTEILKILIQDKTRYVLSVSDLVKARGKVGWMCVAL